jgi:hypothetical protein
MPSDRIRPWSNTLARTPRTPFVPVSLRSQHPTLERMRCEQFFAHYARVPVFNTEFDHLGTPI